MDKEVFVIEFPLIVEKWQADILNKRYEHLRTLYNYVQGKLLRQYIYFAQMGEYKNCKTPKERREFFKTHAFHIKGISGRNKFPLDITFTEYGIHSLVTKLAQHRIGADCTYGDKGVNSMILDHMAAYIWSSWNKKLYDINARRISFKDFGEINTFGVRKINGARFCGLNLHLDIMTLDIKINGKNGQQAKFISLPVRYNLKHADYEMNALAGGFDSIKVLTVVRRMVRGRYKYYLQMTIEGVKPQKGRHLGNGRVGIDIGPTTIAVSSNSTVSIDKLAAKCDNIEQDIQRIGRKIDRSRRAMNPDNFNADGTVKRGVRLTWVKSERYKALCQEKAELQRKQAAIRKAQHIERANTLISEGDTFIIESNPIKGWTARAKETKVSEKTGRSQKKKRWGKSVANHAPSMFVTILENKVKSLGGTVIKADVKNAASQYDFTDGTFTKHELDERGVTLSNGDTHQRDMLSAFNLQHLIYDAKELKQYDQQQMEIHYPRFCELEQQEIEKYKQRIKTDDRSTIAASRL